MHSFSDNANRKWHVEITVDSIKRTRALIGFDLLSICDGKGESLTKLVGDIVLLCDVLYCVCKPQLDTAGVSDEQFGASLGGDSIETATDALLDALADFFPPSKRKILQQALAKIKALEKRACSLAAEKLESPQVQQQMEASLTALFDSVTNSPESLASTLDHSP